jgi:AcrR family transcriptional regulator
VKDDKKTALLNIGERLISKHGYREVSVKDIAAAAGMAAASFYTYFTGKEALFEEVIDRLERKAISELEKRVQSFRSPLNKLRALFRSVIAGLRGNAILIGVYSGRRLFRYPGSERRAERGSALLAGIESTIDGILAEGGRKGIFRIDVFRNPKQMLMGVFRSLLSAGVSDTQEDLIADVSMLVERGMKRWIRLRMRDERLDRRASRIP